MNAYIVLLVVVIILGIPSIIIINKFPKSRPIFVFLFTIAIFVLGYLLYYNIRKPIVFEKQLDIRTETNVNKLKDIRDVQVHYKDKYGKYTGSFDTLISFVKYDSLEIQKIVTAPGQLWDQDAITKEDAIKKGILIKSSVYVPVADSIWKNKDYSIENIKFVPFTENKVEYTLGAGEVETGSKVKVKVFECYTLYTDVLNNLDEQLVVNYIDERTKYGGFEGIKVGSLTEATNNAGNWEQ